VKAWSVPDTLFSMAMRPGFNLSSRSRAEQLFDKEHRNETVQAENNSDWKRDLDRIDSRGD
jgi:hypothetical protein